jgi:hypothetical protein
MFHNLSDAWIAVIIIIIAFAVTGRWIVSKLTGKELVKGDSDIFTSLRTKLVSGIATSKYLTELEKTQGRDAVKVEIEKQIKTYISSTDALSPIEKDLLVSLDLATLVNFVEKELIRLQILT